MKKFHNRLKLIFFTSWKPLVKRAWVFLIIVLLVTIDRLTKTYWFGDEHFSVNLGIIDINRVRTLNTSAAFGLSFGGTAVFKIFGLLIFALVIFAFFTRINLYFVILFFVIGSGSLGNVIDRFIYEDGGVRDFISFPWWRKFPIWNVADMYVSIGLIVLIISILYYGFRDKKYYTN